MDNAKFSSGGFWAMAALVVVAAAAIGYFAGAGQLFGGVVPKKTASQVGLDNKVIKAISQAVDGRVGAIRDRELTLEEGGDRLSVTITENTRINRMTLPKPPPAGEATVSGAQPEPPLVEQIKLTDIKVGDRVTGLLVVTNAGTAASDLTVLVEEK